MEKYQMVAVGIFVITTLMLVAASGRSRGDDFHRTISGQPREGELNQGLVGCAFILWVVSMIFALATFVIPKLFGEEGPPVG